MAPTLFHCRSNYATNPPTYVNPLILQRFSGQRILVVCAREKQLKELRKKFTAEAHVFVCGWWPDDIGLTLSDSDIQEMDVVVILDRDRIDIRYLVKLVALEQQCLPFTPKTSYNSFNAHRD